MNARWFLLGAVLSAAMSAACSHAAPLPPKAIQLNHDGALALAAGDLTTAEARIALALEYNPRFTEAWVNLGYVELRRGNFTRAHKHFVHARDLNPDLPTPHHALGVLAERQGHDAEAERHYRAALRVDPGFAPARANLGRKLFEHGAFEEAREELASEVRAREQFLRLTEVAPETIEGWRGLCESLLRLDRVADAEDVLSRARERLGDAPVFHLLEARALLRHDAFAQAEAMLVPLTSGDEPALVASAVARASRGDRSGAIDAAKRALALNPEDDVARFALKATSDPK
jgi:Flp pilus assembly protein TadD